MQPVAPHFCMHTCLELPFVGLAGDTVIPAAFAGAAAQAARVAAAAG
jgi:hypothetical protein